MITNNHGITIIQRLSLDPNDFWCIDGNYWYKGEYSYTEALHKSSSLVNCIDCIDCSKCTDCSSCTSCIDTTGCISGSYCVDCIGVIFMGNECNTKLATDQCSSILGISHDGYVIQGVAFNRKLLQKIRYIGDD